MSDETGLGLYNRITDAAAAAMAANPPPPSLAEAAEAAGVPMQIAIAMFPSDEKLRVAVIERFVVQLVDAVVRRVAAVPMDDPLAQHREAAMTFLDWGFDNMHAVNMLVSPSMLPLMYDEMLTRYSQSMYEMTQQLLDRAVAQGQVRADLDVHMLQLLFRALTTGMTAMEANQLTQMWGQHEDTRAAMKTALDQFYDLIRA